MNQFPTIPPEWLCRVHVVSAHGESHTRGVPHFRKRYRVDGWLKSHCFEPVNFVRRHDELEAEINRRKTTGEIKSQKPVSSPIEQPDFSYLPIEQQRFRADHAVVFNRIMQCPDCAARILCFLVNGGNHERQAHTI